MPASEKLTIETPEQIALEFPLASAGSRFLALAIDTLLQIAGFTLLGVVALIGAFFRITPYAAFGTWALAIVVILGFVLYYGYFAVFETLWNGQTPGKRLVQLRVITASGRPITAYESLLRNLVRIVDQLPIVYTVGLLSVFFTERNQRLGDLAADTVVVHEQPAGLVGASEGLRGHGRRQAVARRGAAKLTPQELAVIETFLSRRDDLPYRQRVETAAAIAARIRRRLDVVDAAADEVLLEEVAAEARGGYR